MNKTAWLILGFINGVIGSFYEFLPRQSVKAIAQFLLFDITLLGHRLRQNDLILIATLLLIVSVVSFYKAYTLEKHEKNQHHPHHHTHSVHSK